VHACARACVRARVCVACVIWIGEREEDKVQ